MNKLLSTFVIILSMFALSCSTDDGVSNDETPDQDSTPNEDGNEDSDESEGNDDNNDDTETSVSQVVTFNSSDDSFEDGNNIIITAYKSGTAVEEYSNLAYSFSKESTFVATGDAIKIDSLTDNYSYCAVYPVQSSTDIFTLSLQGDQSSASGYKDSNLLVAKSGESSSTAVELNFESKLPTLCFTVNITDERVRDVSEGNITATVDAITTTGSQVDCNTIDNTYTAANSDSFTAKPSATASTGATGVSYSAVIAPQTIESGEDIVDLTVKIGGQTISSEQLSLVDTKVLTTGVSYNYNINITVIDKDEVIVEVVFDGEIASWDEEDKVSVITLSADIPTNFYEYEQQTISSSVTPTTAYNKTLRWRSSDSSILTVDAGVVTAVSAGTAYVTAESTDGSAITSNQLSITVSKVYFTSQVNITSQGSATTMDATTTLQLYASVDSNATYQNQEIIWSVADEYQKYITVSEDGLVTALDTSYGEVVKVIATATDNPVADSAYGEFTINVNAPEQVTINNAATYEGAIYANNLVKGTSFTLTSPEASGQSVTWVSNNQSVATVDYASGEVTFQGGLGEVTITAQGVYLSSETQSDNIATVTFSVPAGYWHEEYSQLKDLSEYAYSSATSGATVNTDSQSRRYISVPVGKGGGGSTYQAYYFVTQNPSEAGLNTAYPYMVIHTENLLWKSYYESGVMGTKTRTVTSTGTNAASVGSVYKTSRSDYSVLYVLTGNAYCSNSAVTDSNSTTGSAATNGDISGALSEYIYKSNALQIEQTHDISLDDNLSNIALYGARTCKTLDEVKEYAILLGSNGLTVSNVNTSNATLSTSGTVDYWTKIVYSDNSEVALPSPSN